MDKDIADLLALVRKLTATQWTHRFMIEQMLTLAFFQIPKPQRLVMSKAILDASIQTEQYAGMTKGDDLGAVYLSDMVEQFQEQVDQIVGKALTLTEAAEEAGAAEFYRKSQSRDQG